MRSGGGCFDCGVIPETGKSEVRSVQREVGPPAPSPVTSVRKIRK